MGERFAWVAWEKHTRSRSLAQQLNADLHEITYKGSRFARYLVSAIKTVAIFRSRRYKVVFFQNPSILLAVVALLSGRIYSQLVVMDAHNSALYPLEGRYGWLNAIAHYLIKRCPLTLVTNKALCHDVERIGGKGFVLPDPIPDHLGSPADPVDSDLQPSDKGFDVAFICTWAADEPVEEVLKAAETVDALGVRIFITGRIPEKMRTRHVPPNVTLTGFLSEYDYVALLKRVDVIMDLTTRDNCLVCGGYEGVALGKPLILSDNQATKDYFSKGVEYTNNFAPDIAQKIGVSMGNLALFKADIAQLKDELMQNWQARKADLLKLVVRHQT